MGVLEQIAGTVVIRHVCHCDGSTECPSDEAAIEHTFTVDGEEFPWLLSERGPIVRRVTDDLYAITVEILSIDRTTFEALAFAYTPLKVPHIPILGGRQFPWLLDDSGCKLEFGHKKLPMLTLTFFARKVDAIGIDIADARPTEPVAVYCNGGDCISPGKDECFWCGGLYADLRDHHQQAHLEHISTSGGYRVS